ncbi:FadR/GntR family transcriptional regulator [uncultured Roseobacter sp.]|uniref:FadR/GntR family transcriptional regulator n=1 Tax=uncultured Roseobacter sp. TaxID=114847 RepID=UPI002635179D|nr:FadR/GntR family transcriptional regulator [uncultured Roseobacter sp.]
MTECYVFRVGLTVNYAPESTDNAAAALATIRQMIETGKLPANGRLPTERELAAELGCGRRTVRRALDTLETEGLIWRKQGSGTFAGQPPDPAGALAAEIAPDADPLVVMEARLCIEPALADLCAKRATGEDVEKLRKLARRASQPLDADTAELWDGALHRAIARIAGNRVMLTAFALLDEVRMGAEWQEKRHRARTAETMTLYDRQHRDIIDAIERRDGQAAAAAMRAHLEALSENLKASMERSET